MESVQNIFVWKYINKTLIETSKNLDELQEHTNKLEAKWTSIKLYNNKLLSNYLIFFPFRK